MVHSTSLARNGSQHHAHSPQQAEVASNPQDVRLSQHANIIMNDQSNTFFLAVLKEIQHILLRLVRCLAWKKPIKLWHWKKHILCIFHPWTRVAWSGGRLASLPSEKSACAVCIANILHPRDKFCQRPN